MTVSLTPRPSPASGRGERRESAAPTFTVTVMALNVIQEHESHDGFPHPQSLSRKRARGAS
jgi:hypothetical protein